MLLRRLSRKIFAFVCILAIISSAFSIFKSSPAEAEEDPNWHHEFTREELAYRWAPVWKQNTDDAGAGPEADYITAFNYDGEDDWSGENNWDNLGWGDKRAFIYYSVVETSTHWFVGYYDFHPRDWDSSEGPDPDEHENDMEGALLVVAKTGGYGSLLLIETQAHGNFYQYSETNLSEDHDDTDGDVDFDYFDESPGHPILYLESGGHGVYGSWEDAGKLLADDWPSGNFPGGDGVVYYPRGIAEEPDSGSDNDVGYALVDIQELWEGRYWGEPLFDEFGVFAAKDQGGGAQAPWRWDDGDDGHTYTGEVFFDPADMVDVHLNNLEVLTSQFDHEYSYNPYAVEVRIDWYEVQMSGDTDSDADPYITLYMQDGEGRNIKVMGAGYADDAGWSSIDGPVKGSQFNWQGWDIPPSTNVVTGWQRNYFYGIRYPGESYFGIRCRERDEKPDAELWTGILDEDDEWLMGHYWVDDHWETKEDEYYTHWYGPPGGPSYAGVVSDGLTNYIWGGSNAQISLLGDVVDDDTTPPTFPEPPNPYPTYPGDRVVYTYPGDIIFRVKIYDDSGISEVYFDYRVGSATGWEEITVERYDPAKPQQAEYLEFEYSMPRSVWVQYAGQTIYFRWRAIDNDIDREGDRLEGFSNVYEGPKISSLVGTHPSAQHNAVAFETSETEEGQDLDGDGYVDNDDTVIRYLNTVSWNVTNTGVVGERPSLFWPIIAFQVNEASVDQDLNGDDDKNDCVIHYYNMSSKETTNTTVAGLYPSISGNIIAFQTIENFVNYYDISTQEAYPIEAGKHPSISGNLIAYESSDERIKYRDVGSYNSFDVGEGRDPSISGNIIAFERSKEIQYYNIEAGLPIMETDEVGEHPSTNGEIIAFETYELDVDKDLNGDGFLDDRVIRTYYIESGEVANTGLVGECPSCPVPLALAGSVTTYFMAFQQSETSVGVDLNYDGDQNDHAILFIPQTVYTPPGPDIDQRFEFRKGAIISGLVLNYLEVRGLGGTTLVLPRLKTVPGLLSFTPPSPEPTPKGGRILGDPFDIITTADVVGPIGITINYDPTDVMNEENLGIMEFNTDTNQWNDITTGIDPINHRIFGQSPGFSTFAVIEWTGITQPEDIFVGQEPSVDGNIIAFSTSESEAGLDLNEDDDTDDNVIQYYDLVTKTLTNTGVVGKHPSISGNIIAFDSDSWLGSRTWLGFYNITDGKTTMLETGGEGPHGEHPCISGNIMAFHDLDYNVIQYIDIVTPSVLIDTRWEGKNPAISGNIIAFTTSEEQIWYDLNGDGDTQDFVIRYYNMENDMTTNTGLEVQPEIPVSISGNVIAFVNPESFGEGHIYPGVNYQDINEAASHPVCRFGENPSISGNIITFTLKESLTDKDLNHDGDKSDCVLCYYDISTGQITNTAEAASKASLCGNIFAFSTPESMTNQDLNGDGDTDDTIMRYATKALPQPALPPTSGLDLLVAPIGGAVSNLAKKAAVKIPPGALLEDTIVTVDAVPEEQYDDFLGAKKSSIVSTEVYKIEPSSATLTQFAQFTLAYDETKVDETKPEQLQVYSSTDYEHWQREQVQFIDRDLNVVRLWTNHFGYFAILRDTQPATTELTIGTPQDIDSAGNIHVWLSTDFTLIATDALSLPMYTYYRINSAVWTLYENPFTLIGTAGTYNIDYFTIDFARNCETFKSTIVNLEVQTSIESCDSTGTKKDTFEVIEPVYATGSGYSPDTTYNIYVVEDVVTWTDGMTIPTRVPGTIETVTTDEDGNIPVTTLSSEPLALGKYDILVDFDGDGEYDQNMDALDSSDIEVTAGFLVVPEVPLGTAIAIVSMIVAFGTFLGTKRLRTKPNPNEKS